MRPALSPLLLLAVIGVGVGAVVRLPPVQMRLKSALSPKPRLAPPSIGSQTLSQLRTPSVQQEQPQPPPAESEPGALPENLLFWRASMLLVTMSWAANFAVIKDALAVLGNDPADGTLFVAARFLLAALVLSPFLFSATSKEVVKAGLSVGALCAFGYAAQALALAIGSQAGACAFICSLQSVVVPLIKSRTVRLLPTLANARSRHCSMGSSHMCSRIV